MANDKGQGDSLISELAWTIVYLLIFRLTPQMPSIALVLLTNNTKFLVKIHRLYTCLLVCNVGDIDKVEAF